jgi:hypothetical protein
MLVNYIIIEKMNLSIQEKEDFNNAMEDLTSNPLNIPIIHIDDVNILDVNISDDNNLEESKTLSIVPKKKQRREIDLGEFIVPVSSKITSGKRLNKALKNAAKNISGALKHSSARIPAILNSMDDEASISDVSMDSALQNVVENNTQAICILKDEIVAELGKKFANIDNIGNAESILEKAIKGEDWKTELLALLPNKFKKLARKIRDIVPVELLNTTELVETESEDDVETVSSEESVSVNPDIPEKYTERQLVEYPEETKDPVKEPFDNEYLELQVSRFMISYKLKLRVQKIHQNQKDAAKNLCETFSNKQKVIQLLISRTQTGKTGCMIEFIYQYVQKFQIPMEHIFIITPLSSTDWKLQTKERFPEDVEKRIYHLPELMTRFRDDVENKKNVLILIDEAHCASLKKQTLQKLMSEDGLGWNLDKMFENDIKLVQFSATPDGLIYGLMKREWPEEHYHVHMMQEGQGYYGISQMMGRSDKVVLKQSKDLNGRNKNGLWLSDEKQEDVEENINEIFTDMVSYSEPKYCIIRGHGSNFDYIKENIFSTADKFLRSNGQYELFDWKIKEYIQDGNIDLINDLLKVKPKKHVIVLIKEKLKCSNTIIKTHIGVVYERLAKSVMDSFIIQGLIGRITGYERHDIICYSNLESLEKYEDLIKNNFSKESLKTISWNSNSTKANKKGTKGKKTWIDSEFVLGEMEEIVSKNKIWPENGSMPFSTAKDVKDWFVENRSEKNIKNRRKNVYGLYDSDRKKYRSEKSVHDFNNLYVLYRGELKKVVSEEDTRKSTDLFWGVRDSARIYPVIRDGKIMYIILYEEN